jgi:DTW domain-containing protein YfiP
MDGIGVAEIAQGETAAIDNRLFVLILQHPREKREALATAPAAAAVLRNIRMAVGLSWPNLAGALGRAVDPGRWAVLYLGSWRPATGSRDEVIALDRHGEPHADQVAALAGLDGVVLLDGNWSEAKALWWRNPWLLKLRRLALNPQLPSRYGRLRREPRREALSTIEAIGLLLKRLDRNGRAAEAALLAALDRLLAASQPGAEGRVAPPAAAALAIEYSEKTAKRRSRPLKPSILSRRRPK